MLLYFQEPDQTELLNNLSRSTTDLRTFEVGSTIALQLSTLNPQTETYRNQDIYHRISLETCGSVEISCLKYERVPPNVLREVWDVTEVWKCFVEWDNVSGQCPLAQALHQNWNEHVKELRQEGWCCGGGAPRGGSANTGRLDCRPHASHFPLYTALDLTVVYRFLTDHLEELVGGWWGGGAHLAKCINWSGQGERARRKGRGSKWRITTKQERRPPGRTKTL